MRTENFPLREIGTWEEVRYNGGYVVTRLHCISDLRNAKFIRNPIYEDISIVLYYGDRNFILYIHVLPYIVSRFLLDTILQTQLVLSIHQRILSPPLDVNVFHCICFFYHLEIFISLELH